MSPTWNRLALSTLLMFGLLVTASADDEALAAPKKSDKCFLWKATSDSNTVYLLGSVHAAKAGLYPLDKTITDAYAAAKSIAVEVDITKIDQNQVRQVIVKKCVYSDGSTLADHLSEDGLKKLKAYLAKKGIPYAQVAPLKPGFVSTTLSNLAIQSTSYAAEKGIDKHFIEKAHEEKKAVIPLETFESQIDAIVAGTDEEAEASLIAGLDDLDEVEEQLGKLFEAWKNGDADWVDSWGNRAIKKAPKSKPIWDALITERNKKMAAKVEGFLKEKETVLVIVGSLHMTGKTGIVQLLKDKGFKVEQLKKAKEAVGAGK